MRTKMSFLLLFVFLGIQSSSQTNFSENKNLSAPQIDLISNYISQFPDRTQLSIALINDHKRIFVGVEKWNRKIITIDNKDSVFEIGSITKVFTSTILSNLVIDSTIHLNDPIHGLLQFELHESSKEGKPITFKTLANHTSGLPFEPDNINISAEKNPENPYLHYDYELLNDYLKNRAALGSVPGEKYQYSNLGAGLLGNLLETKTGKDYESLLQEEIFKKYKMKNSTSEYGKVKDRIVIGLDTCGSRLPHWDCNALKASGGILSDVNDLSKFILANFSKEPSLDLQREATYRNMNTAVALGWEIFEIGGERCSMDWYYKTGKMGGYSSAVLMDPKAHLGIVILSNISGFNKNENTINLAIELLKQVYVTTGENRSGACIAPFLELAFDKGWGTCKNDSISRIDMPEMPIVGVWQKQSDARSYCGIPCIIRTFMPDGKVQSDFVGDPEIDVWGYYSIVDDQIEFEDIGGNACKPHGVYKYKIENDTLRFEPINDQCDGRKNGLTGAWFKK
jgi:CubicO group peptidase (beta-lactamase class C family)